MTRVVIAVFIVHEGHQLLTNALAGGGAGGASVKLVRLASQVAEAVAHV